MAELELRPMGREKMQLASKQGQFIEANAETSQRRTRFEGKKTKCSIDNFNMARFRKCKVEHKMIGD